MNVAEPGHDVSRADHPLSLRLSRIMELGAQDVLGLSVPHLNRVMQQLRSERLITSHSRRVELTNMAGLQTLAHYQPLVLAPIPVPSKGLHHATAGDPQWNRPCRRAMPVRFGRRGRDGARLAGDRAPIAVWC